VVVLAQLLNRDFVRKSARLLDNLLADPEVTAARPGQPDLTPEDIDAARAELAAAIARLPTESATGQDGRAYLPRDPVLALVQSALTVFYEEKHPDMIRTTVGRRGLGAVDVAVTNQELQGVDAPGVNRRQLFGPFEPSDAGWAACLTAMAWRKLKGRHPFNPKPVPPVRIADNARVVLMGDWGSGLPRARKVAAAVRAELVAAAGRDRHVIHLGDVYYSGWPGEYEKHVLPHWPVQPEEAGEVASWSLNANHDMYSGGEGYFGRLLADPRFARQRRSSVFSFENAGWQLLGLDTAYDDHDLHGGQAAWVKRLRDGAPGKKGLLISHHQPFSAYEGGGEKLRDKLAPVLEAGQAQAWFWGHEHRCVLYDPAHGIEYPRCIGHAGVPVYVSGRELPVGVRYTYEEAFDEGFERWALFGFAVLDFDGSRVAVRYVNENGVVHYSEVLE
jgi:hypothetical protein